MIRIAKYEDYEKLIAIWLEASINAHDFIEPTYWINQKHEMKNIYLPSSETWVLADETIVAFVSMVDHHIAALYLAPAYQFKGLGSQLIQFLKTKYQFLTLNVYALNQQGVHFYKKHDFQVVEEMLDENTGAKDYRMEWKLKDSRKH
ncbi:MAG: GNAT family N-acetyltransferase [Pedobacter sp.]|uniref:GNAT family N-acetyltransferase n=1 Tax=Pedobacter sp. TaxID=1411316 RepID=UPI003566FDC3